MSLFITFEGPDGSGKTTQLERLAQALARNGWSVVTTREPGGTRIGDAIRTLLLDLAHTEMSPRTETLLFNAARAQIVDEVIRPALAQHKSVLCDRYADSTLAYQGFGHGQDVAELRMLIRYATGGLVPDMTIFLDIDPKEGLQRKRRDGENEWNRMDAQTLAFHQTVREGYLCLAEAEPDRWQVIDARQPIEAVHRAIWQRVERWIAASSEHSQP